MVCFFCGIRRESRRVRVPSSYPEPPTNVICPNCGDRSEGEYRQDFDRFCICIIPCCCKCQESEPYVACIKCKKPLEIVSGIRCNNCQTITSFRSSYCPSCGNAK